ncbi:MAG: hypothetical protein M1536_02965 [Firmicutes bacterium]|nr:hypothetical protein [Bacillota bacterium]
MSFKKINISNLLTLYQKMAVNQEEFGLFCTAVTEPDNTSGVWNGTNNEWEGIRILILAFMKNNGTSE